ncbi:MAG TPA: asparagine synthase (glutamine-hydrolyzing) [Thermoanaerobaculia bacterium]|jgi:asparagine synthase (glutamine-hydrolysing)|nr:asparagine synthase (glutamine-hydrolyzing) [Thermoanaerobaculia bacterium]
MCGIAGIWRRRGGNAGETAQRMSSRLVHRGPDDAGVWHDPAAGIALGFRRLSIIDTSPAGHQPMQSASGRFTMVFNGEAYNYESIRRELIETGNAPSWRGHSDTEVLLAAFEAWGLEAAVQRFVGMFAFALWDANERKLHLVRDRMGVKPLYFAPTARALLFGSELKAMTVAEEFPHAVNRDALGLYMKYAYVPAPYTIYENVWKVRPGTIVTIDADGAYNEREYWSLHDLIGRATADRFTGNDEEATDELQRIVTESVKLRMISDVPLGVFLSGGVDSSLVASVMQAQSSAPVKTFTIGFREAEYDEATYASAVAKHLGTDHTELYVTPSDAQDVIPKLPDIYDEPFADSSQIPTFLVSRLARQKVTVSLSGDGGDEFFGGYHRYFLGRKVWEKVDRLPRITRPFASAALRAVPMGAWNALLSPRHHFVPRFLRRERAGERIHKLARAMISRSPDWLYREIVTQWSDIVPGSHDLPIAITTSATWPRLEDFTERMMYLDQVSYLPDDILVKVDRASMAVGLEAREPLLDHRLLEFAWRLPLGMKLRHGQGKWILKNLLARYIPQSLIDRPKMGFGLPIDHWLRGSLRDWAESLLNERRLRDDGFLDVAAVRAKWTDHVAGRGEWQLYVWIVLMFQAWLDARRREAAVPVSEPLDAVVLPAASAR